MRADVIHLEPFRAGHCNQHGQHQNKQLLHCVLLKMGMKKPRCVCIVVKDHWIGRPAWYASLAWFKLILLAQPSQSGCLIWTGSFCQSQNGHISMYSSWAKPQTGQGLVSFVLISPVLLSVWRSKESSDIPISGWCNKFVFGITISWYTSIRPLDFF